MRKSSQRPCVVVLREFLTQRELAELREYTLGRESDFESSYVVAPGGGEQFVQPEHRRSRVLFDAGRFGSLLSDRVVFYLPFIRRRLRLPSFRVSAREVQITASNDRDFFGLHSDNSEPPYENRELSFVLYYHHEPKPFGGGELRLYRPPTGPNTPAECEVVTPEANSVVVFPSSLLHEVLPIACPSGAFADSRFTLNGWIHR